ncbi:MAG: ATP-dependent RecD-like DNA helicase [Gemmatimonadetes bacterium]|nr:ATP-dependent RecD-like DNA helicase [Gemmatimonadota bacterium]
MESLSFTVERLTFQSPDSDFAIVRVSLDEPKGESATALGELPGVHPGVRVRAKGEWIQHPRYGRQLRVANFAVLEPHDADGVLRYLSSGAVEGLGAALAKKVVDHFQDETIPVLDAAPHRLVEIRGIGKATAEKVRKAWSDHREIREIMLFLQSHGIGPGFAGRIHRRYGADTVRVAKEDPYRMIQEVRGIGFATADALARELGLPPEDPSRLGAGLAHALLEATDRGNLYLPRAPLLRKAEKLLSVEHELIGDELELTVARGDLVGDEDRIYRPEMYACEVEVGRRLRELASARPKLGSTHRSVEDDIAQVGRRQRLDFTERQRAALHQALERKILVVTGGPGTGKTTITVGLIALFGLRGLQVGLAAPTGRAAKRLADASHLRASTIHRMLAFDPESGEFTRNEDRPLSCDVLIVDEASMIDVPLMLHLLRALPRETRLILIGDVDQLPSVGPGTLLKDLIASGVGGVIVLDQIFRQDETSRIVSNAHRINKGEMPELANGHGFYFLSRETPEEIADTVVDLAASRLPKAYDLHPRDEIQVIAPMYRGDAGADRLNERLRDAINPEGKALIRGQREFRVGDKVMQIRNDYNKLIFNGDIGVVAALDGKTLEVRFSESVAEYTSADLDDLTAAYAVSVHKSQGSEFPAVILPVSTQHFVMLQRNLLYTALTRARRLAVIVGTEEAVRLAVQRDQVRRRYSGLRERLAQPDR